MTAGRPRTEVQRGDSAGESIAEALGGAAVTRVFVHGLPRALLLRHAQSRPEFARYAERALLLARSWDVVCVQGRPDAAYLDELGRLGLGPAADRIVCVPEGEPGTPLAEALVRDGTVLERIAALVAGQRAVELDVYLFTAGDLRLARRLEELIGAPVGLPCADPGVVRRAEHKHLVRDLALELGVPVAEGEVLRLERRDGAHDLAPLRQAVERWRDRAGAVIVRGSLGGSGSATYVFRRGGRGQRTAWQAIARGSESATYLVEELHPLRVSPNLLFHVSRGGGPISRLAVSDQRLDAGLAHRGNVQPSTARALPAMERSARQLAAALQSQGYGGYVGFDFCEPRGRDEETPGPFLAEVNPRVNAALYPAAVLQRLARAGEDGGVAPRAFASGTLSTAARSFGALKATLRGLLFEPSRGCGAVVSSTGGLASSRVGVVALGESRGDALRQLAELTARLGGRPGEVRSPRAGASREETAANGD